jgi:hypothetical protein
VTTKNILQRINAVMQELDYLQKEKKSGMQYSYVSHDKVAKAINPLLVKHGIVCYPTDYKVAQEGNRTQLQCKVVFVNIDDRSDQIIVDSLGYGIDSQDKGPGKAISYAFKYALLKTFVLETGDDPDNDQHVKFEPPALVKAAAEPEEPRPSDHPSVTGTPGASKSAFREAYSKMEQAIRNAPTVRAVKDLWKDNASDIDEWPPDFVDSIKVEFGTRKRELEKALAA